MAWTRREGWLCAWRWASERPAVGWSLWWGFALVVAAARFHQPPEDGDVYTIYWRAAKHWWAGAPLFNGQGTGFIYLPHAAVLFTPFTWLPFAWGGAVWRVVNLLVFAAGTRALVGLARAALDNAETNRASPANLAPGAAASRFAPSNRGQSDGEWFLLATLIVMPLTWSAARHGQMTLAMGGLMMLAGDAWSRAQWGRTAAALLLSVALKPLGVVMLLLAGALRWRVGWRLAVGAAALSAVLFTTQSFDYVRGQYAATITMLDTAAAEGVTTDYAQLFGALSAAGWNAPPAAQTAVRLLAALATLGLCWHIARARDAAAAGWALYALAACYILVFNPRTERNTYALLAPAAAVFVAHAGLGERRGVRAALFAGVCGLLLASYPLGKALTGGPTNWFKPLLCLAFVALALPTWLRRRSPGAVDRLVDTPSPGDARESNHPGATLDGTPPGGPSRRAA